MTTLLEVYFDGQGYAQKDEIAQVRSIIRIRTCGIISENTNSGRQTGRSAG